MGTSTLRRSLHTGLAGLVLTVGGLALVAPAAGAQTDPGDTQKQEDGPRQRPQLTDEQKACLEQAGVTKPAEGQRPTDEQREAFEAAAESCGIDLPARGPGGPGHRPQLTDEQRQCLTDAGVEKPAKGERPTDEQRAAFEAAAAECNIELPAPQDAPAPSSQDQ